MRLNPSNGIANRDHGPVFPDMAGHADPDDVLRQELATANIEVLDYWDASESGEVRTAIKGGLHGWLFERAWYYWRAKGPGIPPREAEVLHEAHGRDCRVDGHCGCPPPSYCKGFAVSAYHIDTQAGLNALAATIRQIVEAAEAAKETDDGTDANACTTNS